MRIRILLCVLLSSKLICAQNVGDTIVREDLWYPNEVNKVVEWAFQLGIDNNKYKSLNQVLSDYKLPGKFSPVALSAGIGWGLNLQSCKLEFYASGSRQNISIANKDMAAFNFSLQQLFHYSFKSRSWLSTSLYTGLSMQIMRLKIDSVYNPYQSATYGSMRLFKEFGYVPIGVQFMNYRSKNNAGDVHFSNRGSSIGLRLAYYISVMERDLLFNRFYVPYFIKHPNYFELTFTLGIYHQKK